MNQIKILQLDDKVTYETKLFRVLKGCILRFTLSPTLCHNSICLFTNNPAEDSIFERAKFNEIKWLSKENKEEYADILITQCGVFQFYLQKQNGDQVCKGSFVVDPVLTLTTKNELSIDSIILQTVLVKSLGPFTEWKNRLEVLHETGYNMIHFSPIQELGESNSSYSIKHHQVFNPTFSTSEMEFNEPNVKALVTDIHKNWNMFSIVDVVWNHVANNSDWIKEQTDAGYNLVNSPHLKPAFLVDRCLWKLNSDIMLGGLVTEGVPAVIDSEYHLQSLRSVIRKRLEKLKLHEYFVVVTNESLVDDFMNKLKAAVDLETESEGPPEQLTIVQDAMYTRFGCQIDIDLAVKLAIQQIKEKGKAMWYKDQLMSECKQNFVKTMKYLNDEKYKFVEIVYDKIIGNTIGHVKYHFVDTHGPRYGQVTSDHSISVRYFYFPFGNLSFEDELAVVDKKEASSIMAHNGWVMGGDALKNFAEKDSTIYLCRELIAWGDSIKLRYGESREDSPYLWDFMKDYTQQMARIFHGFRIDNCHSTPVHVAEYLLDVARRVQPNLYVIAELFTNSEETDNTFVNRLGINSLIRESLGSSSPFDFGRHVYRYGGESIGSFFKHQVEPLKSSMAHAVFMDMTHDNQTQFEIRSVYNVLPTALLVSSSCCGVGSAKGFDELVPNHINVVTEDHLYKSWSNVPKIKSHVSIEDGVLKVKHLLNKLHKKLQLEGFNQIFVDQMTDTIVGVTRHNPVTHESVIFVAHCAFTLPSGDDLPCQTKKYLKEIPCVKVQGTVSDILLEAQLYKTTSPVEYVKDEKYINGDENYHVVMQQDINIKMSKLCSVNESNNQEVHLTNFYPGSIVAIKVTLNSNVKEAVNEISNMLPVSTNDCGELSSIVEKLTLFDLNHVLFRCHNEEVDDGYGGGVYNIPGAGDMIYAGLQGIMSMLQPVRVANDLGHPLCDNIRQGDWLAGYTVNRLKQKNTTNDLAIWLENVFTYMKLLPRYLVLPMFEKIISEVYIKCVDQVYTLMSKFVQEGSPFIHHLALCSVQLCGVTKSAILPPISKSIVDNYLSCVTMAAGLPHFSSGFMRCWGRDTFISLKGLLLIPGRHEEARHLILSFGGVMRHGLIPNLLASGVSARYNARDATWFWLQAVQDYCHMVGSCDILNDHVIRMYPNDESAPCLHNAKEEPLQNIIHAILERHFQGIKFRERNAGIELDRDMSDEGFNVEAGVAMDTGFVYGGSDSNCGTWMDKMGSSELSSNKGHPATPRDGSAVEIIGMCKSALKWLAGLHKEKLYSFNTVTKQVNGKTITWSYKEWEERISDNFEKYFYISEACENNMINKRCIYKDTYLSTNKYTDFQLRPNFPIAMCAAPDLFTPTNALKALQQVETHLLGPFGLKTLDPNDWNYDGYYENHLDNDNFKKAKGFNYHQGPEWTWVLGPFLRAKLLFSRKVESSDAFEKTKSLIMRILSKHYEAILWSPWRGLTELTNENGAFCEHSCPTQAWSAACLLEVLYDMENK